MPSTSSISSSTHTRSFPIPSKRKRRLSPSEISDHLALLEKNYAESDSGAVKSHEKDIYDREV